MAKAKAGPLGPFGLLQGPVHHYVYLAAAIIMGSICLVSTVITFVLAKTHNDLKQRGRYLVFWNGLSATGIVTVYLMLNSFVGDFPCFVLLWTSYLCILPWLLTYLARGWRLVYIYNQQVDFGKTNIQHNNAFNQNDARHESQREKGAGPGVGIGIDDGSASLDPNLRSREPAIAGSLPTRRGWPEKDREEAVTSRPDGLKGHTRGSYDVGRDNTSTNAGVKKNLPLYPPISKSSTLAIPSEQGPTLNNITSSTTTPPPSNTILRIHTATGLGDSNDISTRAVLSHAVINVSPEANGPQRHHDVGGENAIYSPDTWEMVGRVHSIVFEPTATEERHSRWSRYLPFNKATDGRLTIFLMGCMILPLVICLGLQFVKPSPVQINPISYRCGEGPVFYPIYAIVLGFLAIGCPVLSWKLWWIKDGFGIRNELLITMMIGLPGFVLYFISPLYFKTLEAGHWNHVNWLILTIFLAHVNSVVLPLGQFFLRQRPKRRSSSMKGSGNLFFNILRWDSSKTYSGTPTFEMGSDSSSFQLHSRPASQIVSLDQQSRVEQYHPSVSDNQSVARRSIESQGAVGYRRGGGEDNPSIPANISATAGRRLRGMKGFWAKYGKDADGNIIPLSEMNPRAFEYALQDPEMMGELVKFSVMVFSAENTKFLQEYDGLQKQVQEYYMLAGHGGSGRNQKHGRHATGPTDSTTSNKTEGGITGIPISPKSRRKKSSLLGSLTPSRHNKRSIQGAIIGGDGSDVNSYYENRVDSIQEVDENTSVDDGDPGSSTAAQPYALSPVDSFRKHGQDAKEPLWKPSLQSSIRNHNPAFTPLHGPLHEEEDGEGVHAVGERRSRSAPLSLSRPVSERHYQLRSGFGGRAYHSEATMSTITNENDSKHNSGENESGRSSLSWYGRGNTGSALSYHDVTPSDINTFQDVSSNENYAQSQYFASDFDPMTEYRGGDLENIVIPDTLGGEGHSGGDQNSGRVNSLPSTMAMSPSPQHTVTSTGSHYSKPDSGVHSPLGSRHRARHSLGSSSIQQRQTSRFAYQYIAGASQGPVQSPSSCASAPFTPRLSSQPQLQSPSTVRPSSSYLTRSMSGGSVLTAEELRQMKASSSIASDTPTASLMQQQYQQRQRELGDSQLEPQVSWPLSLPQSQHQSQPVSRAHSHSRPNPDLSPARHHRPSQIPMTTPYQSISSSCGCRTTVPRALLPAYWEISRTFIMPNATLELNLDEHHVKEIKRLFMNSECYLEMYEPIAKEVQELVYLNVWPRFVQSIQRQPQGLPGKLRRTWNAFFGHNAAGVEGISREGQSDHPIQRSEESMNMTSVNRGGRGGASWNSKRRSDHVKGSTSQDQLQQSQVEGFDSSGFADPSPPQASYIHGHYGYLGAGGDESVPGIFGLSRGYGGDEKEKAAEEMEMDVGQFGVMQDLDLTALKHIATDPK